MFARVKLAVLTAVPHVKGGRLRAPGVTGAKRRWTKVAKHAGLKAEWLSPMQDMTTLSGEANV
jgi:hypothetical protein